MRLYEPRGSEETLERLLADPSIAESVAVHRRLPPRPAVTRPIPDWLDPRLTQALSRRGISSLYSHQAEAIDAVRGGEDIVVVTPTASGKSLCYNLPVLQSIAEDPAARALYLFPTKALGQDQTGGAARARVARARWISRRASTTATRPAPIRSVIRAAGQIVVTNPDMLHSAILPASHQVVPAVRAAALRGHRRGARLPRRLRRPRGQRPRGGSSGSARITARSRGSSAAPPRSAIPVSSRRR